MEASLYGQMAELQQRHWWFQGRRAVLRALLSRQAPATPGNILEIGCGPGGNLDLLASFGPVRGIESSADARALLPAEFRERVADGALPDRLPPGPPADWICLFDVLEHLDDDAAALAACRERLAPGGAIVVTVPAYRWLWSPHDTQHHHRRRYTRGLLLDAAARAGLSARYCTYFNTLLFPLAVLARLRDRSRTGAATGSGLPPPLVNSALRSIFASERALLGFTTLPFGLSIFAVLQPR